MREGHLDQRDRLYPVTNWILRQQPSHAFTGAALPATYNTEPAAASTRAWEHKVRACTFSFLSVDSSFTAPGHGTGHGAMGIRRPGRPFSLLPRM